MVRLIKKASSRKLDQIGRVDLDDDVFTIAADGNLILGLVNGYRIVDSNIHGNPEQEVIPLMSSVISKSYRDKWYEGLKINVYEGEWDTGGKYPSKEYLAILLDNLKDDVGSENIEVHESNSEGLLDKPKVMLNKKSLLENLNNYSENLEEVLIYAEHMLEKVDSLSRIRLVESMWGVKEVVEDIELVKSKKSYLDEVFNNLGLNCNLGRKAVDRLSFRINSEQGLSGDDRKYVRSILVPDSLTSFDETKKAVSKMVVALEPFYRLEEKFKALTGNPVNWSIPNTIIEDFREAYEVLVKFLMNVPSLEKNVMEPLEVMQVNLADNR